MYIQAQNPRRTLNVPDNYSGNAFREDYFVEEEIGEGDIDSAPEFEKEDNSPKGSDNEEKATPVHKSDSHEQKPPRKDSPLGSLISALAPPKIHPGKDGLLSDLGFEELLIIGLALLLAQSGSDDDILILLLILLFYK